ncbi:hypothetical protein E0H65_11145 [Rhizobium leguminosarum bv. viciae]|nr:hypothetical protein E0H65_11145 [Rhizobium leguminosarum bv. viciae]
MSFVSRRRQEGAPASDRGSCACRRGADDGKLRHVSYKGLREAADQLPVYELDDIRQGSTPASLVGRQTAPLSLC